MNGVTSNNPLGGLSNLINRLAVGTDRVNEIGEHSTLLVALLILRIITLPTWTTSAPTLSLPVIIARIVGGQNVKIIPTPFTEAMVFEINEVLKYIDPNYSPQEGS